MTAQFWMEMLKRKEVNQLNQVTKLVSGRGFQNQAVLFQGQCFQSMHHTVAHGADLATNKEKSLVISYMMMQNPKFYEMLTSQMCTDLCGCELGLERRHVVSGIMADLPDYLELP